MLSDDGLNEIIVEAENGPSGVVPQKTLVNSSFSMVSSISDIDVTDSQSFRNPDDRKSKQLRFSTSLNESFPQTLHRSPGSVGIDASHENIQGGETLGERS